MAHTTYNYNTETLVNTTRGQWTGDATDKHGLPHPYQFILSSQITGYAVPESGTPGRDHFVQMDYNQNARLWTPPAHTEATVVEYSHDVSIETEDWMEEPRDGYMYDSMVHSDMTTASYHYPPMFVDTPSPPPTVAHGSLTSINTLYDTGSGTPTGLRDACCYSDASWVVPTVGTMNQQLEPQVPTSSPIQILSPTSYYTAHQPIPLQQQSRYSALAPHVAFMNHVQSQTYSRKQSTSSTPFTPPQQMCISSVETPLTSRHRKPVCQSVSLPSLPLSPPAPSGSVNQTNSSVPRALNRNHSYPQPPVQETPYQQYTMLSTKAVKGRHLLPALPAPPAVVFSKPLTTSSMPPASPSANVVPASEVTCRIPMKREASERLEEDIIRSRPVSRRGSAVSASEAASSYSKNNTYSSHNRSASSDSIIIPPPFRRGNGSTATSSMLLPRGTSAVAIAAAAALSAVTNAHSPHLVYPHPPVVFDFAMGSSKGSGSEQGGVGGGAQTGAATRNVKEPRRPSLACTFCRERKIACGRPPNESENQTCNQCARRGFFCKYTNDTKGKRGESRAIRKKRGVSTGTESSAPSTPSTV